MNVRFFHQVHSSIYNGMVRFHRSIQADQQQNPLFQRQHTRFYNHKQLQHFASVRNQLVIKAIALLIDTKIHNNYSTKIWKILPASRIKQKNRECIAQNALLLKFYRSQLSRFFLFCFCCDCCCCFRRMNSRTERVSDSSWSRFATSRLLSCISIGSYFSP